MEVGTFILGAGFGVAYALYVQWVIGRSEKRRDNKDKLERSKNQLIGYAVRNPIIHMEDEAMDAQEVLDRIRARHVERFDRREKAQ